MGISDISKSFIDGISDLNLRSLVIELLNIIESQHQTIAEIKVENQKLKDEINRLKGEQGKPDFSVIKKNNVRFSSEQERKKGKSWHKEGKKDKLG